MSNKRDWRLHIDKPDRVPERALVSEAVCRGCGRQMPRQWRWRDGKGRLTDWCIFTSVCESVASGERPDYAPRTEHGWVEPESWKVNSEPAACAA